jgi:amino acid transporter
VRLPVAPLRSLTIVDGWHGAACGLDRDEHARCFERATGEEIPMPGVLTGELFAIGRDGVLPGAVDRVLAIVHPRLRSPIGATSVLAALGAACLLLGEKRLLLIVSGNFAEYFLIGAAVVVGRARGLLGQNFKVPLHPLVPLIAIGAGAGVILANWGDAGTARKSMALLLGIFAAAFIWHEARIRQGRPPIDLKGSDIDE